MNWKENGSFNILAEKSYISRKLQLHAKKVTLKCNIRSDSIEFKEKCRAVWFVFWWIFNCVTFQWKLGELYQNDGRQSDVLRHNRIECFMDCSCYLILLSCCYRKSIYHMSRGIFKIMWSILVSTLLTVLYAYFACKIAWKWIITSIPIFIER